MTPIDVGAVAGMRKSDSEWTDEGIDAGWRQFGVMIVSWGAREFEPGICVTRDVN